MDNVYGLGFVLNLEDNATKGFENVWNTFDETETRAEKMCNGVQSSFSQFESLTISGYGLQKTGDSLLHVADSLIGKVREVGREVIHTGDDFEQSRKTMEALYKDAVVAKQKMAWAMNLASQTPFDVKDVTSMMIGLKGAGVDADTTFKDVNGTMRTFAEYVGDLAGLRPDVGLQGVMIGVRNAIGGDGGKSLRARMDIDPANIIGHKLEGTAEQIMKDIVTMSQKVANGLMVKLDGTWNQLVSNLEDQKTRFMLAISDEGAFDAVKKSLVYVSKAVDSFDDNKLKKMGSAIADAFSVVWKPIDFCIKKIVDLIVALENLIETHPMIAKVVLVILSLTSAIIGATGLFLKFAGGILTAVGSMGTFLLMAKQMGGISSIFAGLGTAVSTLVAKMIPLALVVGGVYLAWRSNFMGIRDIMQSFVNNCHTAFSYSKEVAEMSFSDMCMALDDLQERFDNGDIFAGLTIGLIKIRVLWDCLVDAWSDNTLSDENFKKAQVLGILPLIEGILTLKENFEHFCSGFKQGWNEMSQIMSNFGKDVGEVISNALVKVAKVLGIHDKLQKKMQKFKDLMRGITPEGWDKIGSILGKITFVVLGAVVGFRSLRLILKLVALPFLKLISIGRKVYNCFALVSGLLMTNPFALWISVIVGLVVAFVILYKKSETFRNCVKALGRVLLTVGKMILTTIIDIVQTIIVTVMAVVTVIFTVVSTIVSVITTVIMGIIGTIASAGAIIYGAVYTIVSGIVVVIYTILQTLVGIVATIGYAIVSVFTVAFGLIRTTIEIWLGVARTIFEIFKGVVETVVAIVVAIFTGDFTNLGETLRNIWHGVGERIKSIWQGVCDKVSSIWSGIGNYLQGCWNSLVDLWHTIMGKISSFAKETVDKVKGVWNGIGDFFSGVWNGIISTAKDMFSWLESKFSWLAKIIDKTKTAMSKIGEKVSGGGAMPGSPRSMVGLSTGGYVKTTGIACLHPNEVVVNDETTQMLRNFLISAKNPQEYTTQISPTSVGGNTEVDNSITIEKGAIVIQGGATEGNEEEIADKIMRIIERKKEIKRMFNYEPI